jgi:hypothetical protein
MEPFTNYFCNHKIYNFIKKWKYFNIHVAVCKNGEGDLYKLAWLKLVKLHLITN